MTRLRNSREEKEEEQPGRPERESEENFTMLDGKQDATAEWLLVLTPRHHYSHWCRMRCTFVTTTDVNYHRCL